MEVNNAKFILKPFAVTNVLFPKTPNNVNVRDKNNKNQGGISTMSEHGKEVAHWKPPAKFKEERNHLKQKIPL